ncbi:MAG: Na+/H+ antiporter subunit D, partial [Proteobacteria bacterium]|nr:Na+/H+ antiporter subunit D [Pseudomonadota bacterium]
MPMTSFLHPSLGFLALALLLPFLPAYDKYGKAWRWLLVVPPLLAIWSVMSIEPGVYGTLHWVGTELILGRVDKLSLVFAQVFAIMSLAGMIYAMHVEDRAQHAMAALYVAGGFGCVFAGDLLTVFVFWELMS